MRKKNSQSTSALSAEPTIRSHTLSEAIIDTIHESLLVINASCNIITASRSFYKKFCLAPGVVLGKSLYSIADGQFDTPPFRKLIEEIIPKKSVVDNYEIEHVFATIGARHLRVQARQVINEPKDPNYILVSLFDITEHKEVELERERLMMQKDLLLKEMRHRIANSLQLIASILLLKAETVSSTVSRAHLHDAHERILSIAAIQTQLEPGGLGELTNVKKYLEALCKSLSRSMIGGRKPLTISVTSDVGFVSSDIAIMFGLITTELVINSLKHAFVEKQVGKVSVIYRVTEDGWSLTISDNGNGGVKKNKKNTGLGTSIIGSLANRLQASIRSESTSKGTIVSLIHTSL